MLSQLSSDVELSANVLSSLILAQDIVKAKQSMQQWKLDTAPSTYELAFNSSCVWIAAGDMEGARRSLSAAQSLARLALQKDGLTEAEIADETAVLSVQEAYLQQRCGHPDSALALYTEVLHRHPSDSGVVAVASNNIISLRSGEQRVFDSLKRSSKAVAATQSQAADEEKLTVRQRQILQFNRCLVLLSGRQLAQCRQQVESMSRQFPDCELSALVEAALLTAEKKTAEAEQRLQAFIAQHPLHSAECQLAIAQLALLRGDSKAAIARMEELQADPLYLQQLPAFLSAINTASLPPSAPPSVLPPLRQRPAVVATLAALYAQEAADMEASSKTVDAAVQYWTAAAAPSSPLSSCPAVKPLLLSLLESAADFHLSHQSFKQAALCMQQYGQLAGSGSGGRSSRSAAAMDGKQLEHIAKTVLATAAVDLEAATAQASLLPPLDFSGLDVSKLEVSVAPELLSRKRRPAAADSSAGEDGGSAAAAEAARKRKAAAAARRREKRKAHRRIRYPKGFDPTAPNNPPPDPERWLPKWERTQLDRKGRRRRQQQQDGPMRGAQGGTSASAGNFVPLSAAAAASAAASAPSSASALPATQSAAAAAASPSSASPSSSAASSARGDASAEPRASSSKPAAAAAAAAAAAKKKKKKGKMGF